MRINHNVGGVKSPSKYEPLRGKGYSILLMTPSRDGKCSMGYARSIAQMCVALNALDIDVVLGQTQNSCFVHHSRNLAANEFLKSKHTHLLQIDDDMSWDASVVLDMLLFDKEFICALGRKKTMTPEFAGINYTDENGIPVGQSGEKEEDCLVKMLYVGGAFTLQKKSVFDKVQLECEFTKSLDGFVFYKDDYLIDRWVTEDYWFCEKCTKVGIDIWAYPNVTMGHLGNYNYEGNFFNYLKGLKNG